MENQPEFCRLSSSLKFSAICILRYLTLRPINAPWNMGVYLREFHPKRCQSTVKDTGKVHAKRVMSTNPKSQP